MKKVLVIGELITDRFIYGKASRLAPDGPHPVFVPSRKSENWGGAGNVVMNLRSIRPNWTVDFVYQTTPIIKTRYVDEKSNVTLLRVDENDKCEPLDIKSLKPYTSNEFNDMEYFEFRDYDSIVISDYCKNFLSVGMINAINNVAISSGVNLFIDTKKSLGELKEETFCLKINDLEFSQYNGDARKDAENLIVTRGPDGADWYHYCDGEREVKTIQVYEPQDVKDSVGCGDVFMAALVIQYLEKRCMWSAIEFANRVAAFSVTQKGVCAVRMDQI